MYWLNISFAEFFCTNDAECNGHGDCDIEDGQCNCDNNWNVLPDCSGTLMQFYDSRPPVLWSKWALASSLLQAIKTCRQACPPGYLMHFS